MLLSCLHQSLREFETSVAERKAFFGLALGKDDSWDALPFQKSKAIPMRMEKSKPCLRAARLFKVLEFPPNARDSMCQSRDFKLPAWEAVKINELSLVWFTKASEIENVPKVLS